MLQRNPIPKIPTPPFSRILEKILLNQPKTEPPLPQPSITQTPPTNRLNRFSFGEYYRLVCELLLSRSLPKGLQLHAHVIKSGLGSIPLVSHHLINFYSKTQLPFLAAQLFDETERKSSTTWSSVISSFAQNELPGFAIEYFCRMIGVGLLPDDHIFPSATKACAWLGRVDVGRSVHGLVVKTGYEEDVFVGSSVVDMYGKCGELRDARVVFDEMPVRNVVSWSGMICGYTQMGEDEEALMLFKEALWEGLDVNDFTFSSVVRVCANSTLFELGKQVHGLCLKMSYDLSSFVGSSLVSFYSKCGDIEGADRVFLEVPIRNLGMWNAMLIACAQHGLKLQAFRLFKTMESEGVQPNFITFLGMLYACSHAGFVEEGRYYFRLMKDYGIEPGAQHYASMVDLLGRAGKLQEAFLLIEDMPIEPTESVWAAFLTGCRIHRETELAAFAADRVVELGPVTSGLQMLLSNAYAAVGRYEDVAKARKMLRDRGLKKETGLSWVEASNKVHTFASGDRRHEQSEEIYQKLEELEEGMARAGYIADTSFVPQEVGGEEKSQSIRYHSERLAIAFGLVAFSPDRPIRVMKNLRVCSDCHTAIKFMSKCTGRVIIVRDNNRFHRFEDGKCTCGDYW